MESQLTPPQSIPTARKHVEADYANGQDHPQPHAQSDHPESDRNESDRQHDPARADRDNHDGGGEHDEKVDLDIPHARSGWVAAAAVVAVLLVATLLVVGLLPRIASHKELAEAAKAAGNAPVPVNVVAPRRAESTVNVVMPGTLRPWQEVSIFARSTGYLKGFYVDISNQVKKDQLLAEISTPEIDQQLRAGEAKLKLDQASAAKAKTDRDYAEQTDKRYESLRGTSGVTQQELDQYAAAFNSAVATYNQTLAQVGVSEANVKQLIETQSFERVTAPFDGVVTGRAYDVGSFIIANPTAADITPMFKIAENDVLRAFVSVPQNYALQITKGMAVSVTTRERPGREYAGVVLGTTNYLDPTARSLLTEVRIENHDLSILPGMYVDATFHVTRDHPPLLIPAPALVSNADGNQVGVIKDGKAHFVKVELGVDYGNDVEILGGLKGDEKIIANPGERTSEGADIVAAGDVQQTPPAAGEVMDKPQKMADAGK